MHPKWAQPRSPSLQISSWLRRRQRLAMWMLSARRNPLTKAADSSATAAVLLLLALPLVLLLQQQQQQQVLNLLQETAAVPVLSHRVVLRTTWVALTTMGATIRTIMPGTVPVVDATTATTTVTVPTTTATTTAWAPHSRALGHSCIPGTVPTTRGVATTKARGGTMSTTAQVLPPGDSVCVHTMTYRTANDFPCWGLEEWALKICCWSKGKIKGKKEESPGCMLMMWMPRLGLWVVTGLGAGTMPAFDGPTPQPPRVGMSALCINGRQCACA